MDKKVKSTSDNSRRRFLKRTAAGVAVSSIPAQSVWGACNASGISGGSRAVNVTCVVPTVKGGYGPEMWQTLTETVTDLDSGESTFSDVALTNYNRIFNGSVDIPIGENRTEIEGALNDINAFLACEHLTVGEVGMGQVQVVIKQSFKLADALTDTSTIQAQLAAMYLNGLVGFLDYKNQPPYITSLVAFVDHFYTAAAVAANNGWDSKSDNPLPAPIMAVADTFTNEGAAPSWGATSLVPGNCS